MRSLSLTFREAMHAQQTGLVPIFLLTIEHPDLADGPIRLSSDPTTRLSDDPLLYGTVSQGETYTFVPFSLLLSDEKDEAPPSQKLRIANIDRDIMADITALIRSTATPATVRADLVSSANLDVVEIAGAAFDLSAADYGADTIEISLTIEAFVTEPYPYGTFNPAQFPGLF